MNTNIVPLTKTRDGDEGVIRRLEGGNNLLSRFAAMGLIAGVSVRIVRSSGRGPVILQIAESRIALGAGEAEGVFMEIIPPTRREETVETERREIKVALAGQPNVGKSTLFNILTGLSQHIGNWPGKTVEKKEGAHLGRDANITIVDLPGTYSLSSQSEEERVARDYMIADEVDVIVLVANASALERGLYILAETLLIGKPVILALNMFDRAQETGIYVDCSILEEELGVPVVPMVATKNKGIKEFVAKITVIARDGFLFTPSLPQVANDHRHEFLRVKELLKEHLPQRENPLWMTTKLMEGDAEITEHIKSHLPPSQWESLQALLIKHEDALQAVLRGRYAWIKAIMDKAVLRPKMGQIALTDRIDHLLTRPILGIPALLAFFSLAFFAANSIGVYLQGFIAIFFSATSIALSALLIGAPAWISGLLIDGVIGGMGLVLSFLPMLAVFFAAMSLFEDIGYMARAAFVVDRFMHGVGLHSKSFMPFCIGLACNVPAILGARILETRRERWLTIFLTPFVPCTARLAIIATFSSAFFGHKAFFVFSGLLVFNLLLLLLVGIAANKTFAPGEKTHFIMELPVYQAPNFRTIGLAVWVRLKHFISRAGSLILFSAILVWALSYLPDGKIGSSYLAHAAKFLEPLGAPLGFDWKMITSLLTGLAAKENAIATLGVLYSASGIGSVLSQSMSKAGALSFMTVILLMAPCLPTMAVMVKELGRLRLFFANIVVMSAIAYAMGFIVYHSAIFFNL